MNAIHGSLARFMAERMFSRTPMNPVMSCLYNKNKYVMTHEGNLMQDILLPKPKQPVDMSRIAFWTAYTVGALVIIKVLLNVTSV